MLYISRASVCIHLRFWQRKTSFCVNSLSSTRSTTLPHRATDAAHFILVWLARWFDWCQELAIVQPETFTHWHRQGFRLFWRWESTPGRPTIPMDLQALIRRMARKNPSWQVDPHIRNLGL